MEKKKIFVYVWWYVKSPDYPYVSSFNFYTEVDCKYYAESFLRLRELDGYHIDYEIKSFVI